MTDFLLHGFASALVRLVQAFPLLWVARAGRAAGALAYLVDVRHRRVAQRNLQAALGAELGAQAVRALARENFLRIGENYLCAIKTAGMSFEELRPHLEFDYNDVPRGANPQSIVVAVGHFGNFELYARCGQLLPEYRMATTYRSLGAPALDRVLLRLRTRSGCLYFERRRQAAALRAALRPRGVMLGLLCDQNGGPGGLRLPFLGRECSTSPAAALLAQRYHCLLWTAVCLRVGLGRWRIEFGRNVPTHDQGRPRPLEAMMGEVNAWFEQAVRRDPANWFWVHNRWKQKDFNAKSRRRHADAGPAAEVSGSSALPL